MGKRRRRKTELISDFLSAANIQSMDDIQDLFKEVLAGFMEGSLEPELDDELRYEPYYVQIWFNRDYTYECAVDEMPEGYVALMQCRPTWALPVVIIVGIVLSSRNVWHCRKAVSV